jgi:probable HAF family extracellular repeat protein
MRTASRIARHLGVVTHSLPRGAIHAAFVAAALLTVACAETPSSPRNDESEVSRAVPDVATSRSAARPPGYTITDLGTLGGPFSIAYDLTNTGRVSGTAASPDGYHHAVYWQNGVIHDVGSLGGLNSEAAGRSLGGRLAILSETASPDPLGENFCGFGTGLVCSAAVWSHGVLTRLPTLGGTNAAGFQSNSAGLIVGVAEDGVTDASCVPPQKTHFQAVVWRGGKVHELPPLPGDEVGAALRINDRGQAVGTSGPCSATSYGGFVLGPHAVLWDHGKPIDLGTVGDGRVTVAADVNNRGTVIGSATFADGSQHPFVWTRRGGMRDLGLMSTDPTDVLNTAFEIDDRGRIVGASCDATMQICRGYIWQNGVMTDVNELLPEDSPLYVIMATAINDREQIAGLAIDIGTGEAHAFLATPVYGNARRRTVQAVSHPHARPRLRKGMVRETLKHGSTKRMHQAVGDTLFPHA